MGYDPLRIFRHTRRDFYAPIKDFYLPQSDKALSHYGWGLYFCLDYLHLHIWDKRLIITSEP